MKHRYESKELLLFRSLHVRMNLLEKELTYYINLEKGFEGERYFDERWAKHLSDDWIVLNDLTFEVNNTVFQVDSIFICNQAIYLFEIKNFDGDYYIENNKWYSKITNKEIKNPIHQIDRSGSLFRRILQELGYNVSKIPIEYYIIFVNSEFHLYQAPINHQLIFPAQINRFMDKLYSKPLPQLIDANFKQAEQLLSVQLTESPYSRLPEYSYDNLKKGIMCRNCRSFINKISNKNLVCTRCGHSEGIESAILRSVKEYKMLFPRRKVTTGSIYEWCKIIESKKIIRKVLQNNFTLVRRGQSSYYIEPEC